MRTPSLVPATAARESGEKEPVSAAENPAANPLGDSPAEAEGRRTLSTAFIMMGPAGHLTVELRDGRVMVLRDVVMRRRDYCGVQAQGGEGDAPFCGRYDDVAAARPGPSGEPRHRMNL